MARRLHGLSGPAEGPRWLTPKTGGTGRGSPRTTGGSLRYGLQDLTASASFLLHASAEKYLKAVLVQRGLEAPRTHNLSELLDALEPGHPREGAEARAARLLTELVPTNRYPGDLPEPTAEEAEALARAADVLRALARARLGLPEG